MMRNDEGLCLTCWVATGARPADAGCIGANTFCGSGACWGCQEGALGTGAGWAAGAAGCCQAGCACGAATAGAA